MFSPGTKGPPYIFHPLLPRLSPHLRIASAALLRRRLPPHRIVVPPSFAAHRWAVLSGGRPPRPASTPRAVLDRPPQPASTPTSTPPPSTAPASTTTPPPSTPDRQLACAPTPGGVPHQFPLLFSLALCPKLQNTTASLTCSASLTPPPIHHHNTALTPSPP